MSMVSRIVVETSVKTSEAGAFSFNRKPKARASGSSIASTSRARLRLAVKRWGLRRDRTFALSLAGCLLLTALCGCTPLDLSKPLALPGSKPKPQIPERMVDVWSDTVLHQSGQRGVRGFGGRVMFYTKGSEEPVVVDGTFSVYAFDDSPIDADVNADSDSQADSDHQSPKKKYVFNQAQLADHHSESELGHSYSFWIPWDEVGGPQQQITLISRFVDATGRVVLSKPSRHPLPGIQKTESVAPRPRGTEQAAASKPGEKVVRASYDTPKPQAPAASPKSASAMTTTTIEVPPSFARRLGGTDDSDEKAAQDTPRSGAASDKAGESEPQDTSVPNASTSGSGEKPPATELSAAAAGSPLTRSAPPRFPARRERAVRPIAGRVRTQPYPATWPSALPRTPRPETSTESPARQPAAAEASS